MNTEPQRKKVKQVLEERFRDQGGHVTDDEVLHTTYQSYTVKPIFSVFPNILKSKDYTHLPPLFDSTDNFPITDLYVELSVAPAPGLPDPRRLTTRMTLSEELEARHHQQQARRSTIEQAVHNPLHHNLVILGDPGSGKTSLLRYLSLKIAAGVSPRWTIPIYISLRRYWQEKKRMLEAGESSITLTRYAAGTLVQEQDCTTTPLQYTLFVPAMWKTQSDWVTRLKMKHDEVEHLLAMISGPLREHVIFLLDGFDELASQQDAIESLTREISTLAHGYSWVVTSRPTGFFGGLGEDIRYQVASLDMPAIEDLVSNWFRTVAGDAAEAKRAQVLAEIYKQPRLRSMARNPFLLTLLCYLKHQNQTSLPLQRSEIYSQIVELIRAQLRYRSMNPDLFGKHEYDYLTRFAHFLYTDANNAPKQLFDLDDWTACAAPNTPPSLKEVFLPSRMLNCWREGFDYHFIHLTFQEYFIALHVSQYPFESITPHLYKPHWRVVFRFLAGIYWAAGRTEDYKRLLRAFTEPMDISGLLYIEAAWIMVEAGIEDSTSLLGKDLREDLWKTWSDGRPYIKEAAAEAISILSPGYVYEKVIHIRDGEVEPNPERGSGDPLLRLVRTRQAPTSLFVDSIALLGRSISEQADEFLLELFFSPLETDSVVVQAAIAAIAEKHTPGLRATVINRSVDHDDVSHFKRICKLAELTKHRDFVPWLLAHLPTSKHNSPADLDPLYWALAAIGSPDVEGPLISYIDAQDFSDLPFEALSALASLGTETVRSWFMKRINEARGSTRDNLLIIAIEADFIDPDTILQVFAEAPSILQHAYIDAIGERADRRGLKTDHRVAGLIAKYAFSDHENSDPAIYALSHIMRQAMKSGAPLHGHLAEFRKLLDNMESERINYALTILGIYRDRLSFQAILAVACNASKTELRIAALKALRNYSESHHTQVLNVLKDAAELGRIGDERLLESALDLLAQIDISEIRTYLDHRLGRHTAALACAEQNILVFDDSYVDRRGERHYWDPLPEKPQLDPRLPAAQQQNELRNLCRYLIARGVATKSGKYVLGGPVPLFRQAENVGIAVLSIDKKTGMKFLNGEDLEPSTVQRLMDWVLSKVMSA